MANTIKRIGCLLLALVMCVGIIPATAFAAETINGNTWYGDELSVDVTAGTDGYTFMSLFRKPAHGYEFSGHFMGEGEGPQTFVVIDTVEHDGTTWSPNGIYDPMESNYEVAYCCDVETMIVDGTYYKRMNLEDSEYYDKDAAAKIRAIVTNSYPYVSLEDMKADLKENGYPHADALTRNEIIAAVQTAIWACANAEGVPMRYAKSYKVSDNLQWGYPLYDTSAESGLDVSGSRVFVTYEEVGTRIDSLVDYLLAQDKVYADKAQIVITKLELDGEPVAHGDSQVKVKLNMALNSSGSGYEDDINITIYVNGKAVTTFGVRAGVTNYTAEIITDRNATVKAVASGTQVLPEGVYFYAPKPADVGTDEDETATAREVSQNLVGVAMGATPVYAESTLEVKDLEVEEPEDPKPIVPGDTPEKEEDFPIDKTAEPLDENDQTDVTLTVPGTMEGDIDVVILLGGGMQANRETVDSAINLFKPLMESGKSTVKLGLISLEKGQEIIMELTELDPATYVSLIEEKFNYINNLPAGTTNLHSQLKEAKRMLDEDTSVAADNKYMFVIATGRTYWFDDINGNQATIVNKLNNTYYWGHYLWQSQRGRHTSLYMIPDKYNNNWDAYWADVCKWVAADGNTYVYSPLFDTNDIYAYETWYAANKKELNELGVASSRYGNGIVDPAPVAENFVTLVPAAVGSGTDPQNALNYERAQYESAKVYKAMVDAGYNCYAICSESPNYQNGSEYIKQGAKYTGTSTIQVGHSFMNYLARLGGQTEAPAVWDYTREADGTFVNATPVLQENFFAPIAEDILYGCSVGTTVVDYIGKNENGNFEFIEKEACITLNVGGNDYITTQTSDTEEGSSYAFAASVDAEPTFWLDYYYGDGETTEHFVWTFGENVSLENVAKLTYKLQLTEKRDAAGTYIVPTNNSATLYPVDSDGKNGEPQLFPVPEVDYTVVPGGDIVIKKVDENGNPLTGAAFELFDAEGNSLGEYYVGTNGMLVFEGLKVGTYKLVETVTPAGYIGISEPIYFDVVLVNGEYEAKDAYVLHFPATAYEISNHSFYPAIPQTFVMLDAEDVEGWEYSANADFRIVYCGDSETGGENGVKYYRTALEDVYGANAGALRAIITNSYPYVSLEDMIAAAEAAGVTDAANLTRGDVIAAVQLAIWNYTNGGGYTYRATYSVQGHPEWGYVFNDYEDELPDDLPKNTKSSWKDEASIARVDALFNYLINLDAVGNSEFEAFAYVAEGGKSASQTMIGGVNSDFYTEGNVIVVKNVKVPTEEPKDPPKVEWKSGQASNISFMLVDANGNVEFLYKKDIENETSFEIPVEEGKISAVFVKQGTSGMFWFSEEVDEDIQEAVIECLKDNNPSYKGHNAIAFGAGDHELEFKKNKFVTYTFSGTFGMIEEEAAEEVEDESVEEPVEEETPAPETEDNGKKNNKKKNK